MGPKTSQATPEHGAPERRPPRRSSLGARLVARLLIAGLMLLVLQQCQQSGVEAKKIKLKDLKKVKKYAYLLAGQRKKFYAVPFPFPLPVIIKRQQIYTQVPVVPRYVQHPPSSSYGGSSSSGGSSSPSSSSSSSSPTSSSPNESYSSINAYVDDMRAAAASQQPETTATSNNNMRPTNKQHQRLLGGGFRHPARPLAAVHLLGQVYGPMLGLASGGRQQQQHQSQMLLAKMLGGHVKVHMPPTPLKMAHLIGGHLAGRPAASQPASGEPSDFGGAELALKEALESAPAPPTEQANKQSEPPTQSADDESAEQSAAQPAHQRPYAPPYAPPYAHRAALVGRYLPGRPFPARMPAMLMGALPPAANYLGGLGGGPDELDGDADVQETSVSLADGSAQLVESPPPGAEQQQQQHLLRHQEQRRLAHLHQLAQLQELRQRQALKLALARERLREDEARVAESNSMVLAALQVAGPRPGQLRLVNY